MAEKVRLPGEDEPTMYSSRKAFISQWLMAVPAPPPSSSGAPRSVGHPKWRCAARATRGVETKAREPPRSRS